MEEQGREFLGWMIVEADDRIICKCYTRRDAKRIVKAVNGSTGEVK